MAADADGSEARRRAVRRERAKPTTTCINGPAIAVFDVDGPSPFC